MITSIRVWISEDFEHLFGIISNVKARWPYYVSYSVLTRVMPSLPIIIEHFDQPLFPLIILSHHLEWNRLTAWHSTTQSSPPNKGGRGLTTVILSDPHWWRSVQNTAGYVKPKHIISTATWITHLSCIYPVITAARTYGNDPALRTFILPVKENRSNDVQRRMWASDGSDSIRRVRHQCWHACLVWLPKPSLLGSENWVSLLCHPFSVCVPFPRCLPQNTDVCQPHPRHHPMSRSQNQME